MTAAPEQSDRVTGWRPPAAPVRVGLVGLGNVGVGHHLPAFESIPELAQVVAIADPVVERRSLVAERLGLRDGAAYPTPEALIDGAEVDVVDLATPPGVRVALALRALAAGRAVICEKPLALAPADAASLVAASAKAGIPVGMIHNYVHLPEIVAARAAIAEGAIGDPEIAVVNALSVEDRPGNAAWRPGWRHDPTTSGGGVLMDMLHLVYVAEALLGTAFRRVSAEILVRSPGAGVEDAALCRFETDRSIALVNVGWGVGPGGITVSGPLGRVEIAYAGGGTGPFAPLAAVRVIGADGVIDDRTPATEDVPGAINVRLAETFRAIFGALLDGTSPETTAVDGLRALDATLGAYAAAATGRTIGLPLPADDPVHRRGIAGLAELPLAPGSTIARRGVFGVGGTHV
ncbi:MAG TPA: Gfo/Idh/MocA family oxidoreductase [Candidatus Limnocylindrales bacterium]